MQTGAKLSEDRVYRYVLWRIWNDSKPMLMFVGLNPSTADEKADDPTIRRCVGFAKSLFVSGFDSFYGGIYMLNLFAFRATDPEDMAHADYPTGPENKVYLSKYFSKADRCIAAWGAHSLAAPQGESFYNELNSFRKERLFCLGCNKDGSPKHPLYLPKTAIPVIWTPPVERTVST